MRLPLPGPADILQAAVTVGNGVGDALGLGPRLVTLVGQAEALLVRVGRVVDEIEATMARVDVLLTNVAATDRAAADVVASVEQTASRADSMAELYDASLRQLAPSVQAFAEKLSPGEMEAVISLVDRLPILLKHLDDDVLPILTTLDRVGPDLHQLLEIAQDLQVALGGLPGLGWIRKRADKEEAEAAEQVREIQAVTGKPPGKPKR